MKPTKDDILNLIRAAAKQSGGAYLTHARFQKISDLRISAIYRHFDTWRAACSAAGVQAGENSPANLTPNVSKGKDFAIDEMKRVAELLNSTVLSRADFDAHATGIGAETVRRMFGSWEKALSAAGLHRHPLHYARIDIGVLEAELLSCTRELGRIPPRRPPKLPQ